MSKITYKSFYEGNKLKEQYVYLDGKHVGKILVSIGGEHFQYLPKLNSRKYCEGGEVFTSLRDCQKSLESE